MGSATPFVVGGGVNSTCFGRAARFLGVDLVESIGKRSILVTP